MEMRNISILGNTIEARIFALAIAISNIDMHIKIFTNNEEFKNNIKTPTMFQSQLNMTLSYYFEEELDIPSEEIFRNTNTTLNLGPVFSGITDDDIILPLTFQRIFIEYLLKYNCFSKNFLKNESLDEQFKAFMEWIIQHNQSLISLTPFPVDAFRNDPNADLYFKLKDINPNFDALTSQFYFRVAPHFSSSVLDIDNLKVLLDNKIEEIENIEWIVDPIETITIENIPNNSDVAGQTDRYYRDVKNITHITTVLTHESDLVINTGVSNNTLDTFIESLDDEPLYVRNEIFPFKVLKQYESKIKEKPDVLRHDLIDGGVRIHLAYADKTIIQEYQIEDQPINTTQGYNANLIYDDSVEVETIILPDNLQHSHIINQKYTSNYIFLDFNKLGLNPIMGEQFKTLIAFSKLLTYNIGSISLDIENMSLYMDGMENAWDSFRDEINCMTYYLMSNNKRTGLDFYNIPPVKFQERFDTWNMSFPNLEYINLLGEQVEGLYMSRRYGRNEGKTVSFLRYPFMEFEYCVVGQQKNKINSFTYDFSDKEDLFKDIYYVQKYLYNSFVYANGFTDFETFKNLYLI